LGLHDKVLVVGWGFQGWLLWEDARNCSYVQQNNFQDGPSTGQSWTNQQRWWSLCDNIFKKG